MGKGKRAHGRGGGNPNRVHKAEEREVKRQLRRERARRAYGDASWKRDWDAFSSQLRLLNLMIKDVAGDGNCLFRAIADQIEGDPMRHAEYRRRVCDAIEHAREMYEPFIEDDEPFDEYLARMRRNGTWGGQIEIQAASLAFAVNITIHQLNQPRWQVINFPANARMIHLSYHDGEHYSSVRSRDDKNLNGVPKEIVIVDKSMEQIEREGKEKAKAQNKGVPISEEELTIMQITGCSNRAFVQQLLLDNWGDVNACIDFIYMVGAHDAEFQKEYLSERAAEFASPPNKTLTSSYSSTSASTSSSASAHSAKSKPQNKGYNSDHRSGDDEEDEKGDRDSGDEKGKRKEPRVDSHGRVKHKNDSFYGKKHPNANSKNQQSEKDKEMEPIDPSIHPKLKKFYEKQLTNKERQDRARQQKAAAHQIPLSSSAPPSSSTSDIVDVSDVAKDLGSMMI